MDDNIKQLNFLVGTNTTDSSCPVPQNLPLDLFALDLSLLAQDVSGTYGRAYSSFHDVWEAR
jgi:hypothetical protein